MAQFNHRANIQSSIFPLLSELMGDDVIIDRGDHSFVPDYNPSSSTSPVDRGIAQVIYAHNVMPSTYGFQSVGFQVQFNGPAIAGVNFEEAYLVVSTEGIRTYIGVDYSGTGKIYALTNAGQWILPTGSPTIGSNNTVSVATVNGITYVAVARLGVWKYSVSTATFTRVTLKGIANGGIRGILQSTGYLIVWSDTGVSWSATDDPLDFEPSDISGAGAGEIQEAQGKITFCQQTSYGFIVYTENNAVSVTWSGNTNYPFNFKSIPGAGGVAGGELVTKETVNAQYAYTTNGLQQVYHTGAKTVLSYITDFIAGQVFEDFDEDTNRLVIQSFSTTMKKKLTLVNDRYLVLSYGVELSQPFTHALVLDLTQTRTGKVKIPHNSVFELRNTSPEVIETPRESIAFLQEDGTVQIVDFGLRNLAGNGVMITGRYRLQRSQKTTLQSVTVENIINGADFEMYAYSHIDSKDLVNPQPLVLETPVRPAARSRKFYGTVTGDTLSLLYKGTFNIVSPVIAVTPNGIY